VASNIEVKVRVATPELIEKTSVDIQNFLLRKIGYYKSRYEKYEAKLALGHLSRQREREYRLLAAKYRQKLAEVEVYREGDYKDVVRRFLIYGESVIKEYPLFLRNAIRKYVNMNIKNKKCSVEFFEDSIEIIHGGSVTVIFSAENLDDIKRYTYSEYKGIDTYIYFIILLMFGILSSIITAYGYTVEGQITLLEVLCYTVMFGAIPMLIGSLGLMYLKKTTYIVVTTNDEKIIIITSRSIEDTEEIYYRLANLKR